MLLFGTQMAANFNSAEARAAVGGYSVCLPAVRTALCSAQPDVGPHSNAQSREARCLISSTGLRYPICAFIGDTCDCMKTCSAGRLRVRGINLKSLGIYPGYSRNMLPTFKIKCVDYTLNERDRRICPSDTNVWFTGNNPGDSQLFCWFLHIFG